MSTLGKQIQAVRKQLQLSQIQLEQRSGIKREYISRLERGKLKNPTINTLNKIAQGLGIPLEELLFAKPSSPRQLQDILRGSKQIEQKIRFLKKDLHELNRLLDSIQQKITSCAPGDEQA